MVTIKDGCGCDPCDCDWKQKLKEAYSRAIQSVNKIGDETGRVYYPDGTGFIKVPLPTKKQIDSIAEIDGIKASVDSLNKTVPALETQVTGVTESLVSNVEVLNGTTAGKFKVRIEREKAALIDSNDYDLSKVNSIELIQGSGPAMVKAQLTLSDGTVLRSDDFLFTTESIGTDVYISSFTFKAGNVDGTISADIGLNNGTTLEANNFVVPTDPSVVSTITDLQTRMAAVEGGSIGGLDELKAAVANLQTNKADVTNTDQIITSKRVDTEIVRYKYNATDAYGIQSTGTESDPFLITAKKTIMGQETYAPIGKLAVLDSNGTPTNFRAGGEVWEEVDLNNWPTDWVKGERVKVDLKLDTVSQSPYVTNSSFNSVIVEFTLTNLSDFYPNIPLCTTFSDTYLTIITLYSVLGGNFNGDADPIFVLRGGKSNGGYGTATVTKSTISTYVRKMWRLRL